MIHFIGRLGENTRFCAVTYLLPLILPSMHLSTGWIFLPIGLSLVLIMAVLAPKASQLKFHAIQSIFLYSAFSFVVVMIYLFILYGGSPENNFVSILMYLGMWALVLTVMLVAFLIWIGILFFKTWQGKIVKVPFISKWIPS